MDVLMGGGGTGGHVFAGLALAHEVRRRDPQARILFIGSKRGLETRLVPQAGFDVACLSVSGLRGVGCLKGLKGMMRLPGALWHAYDLVRRFKPDIAVGLGGYAAGPVVLAARLQKIPCVGMEPNAVAGLTTRLVAHLCQRVMAASPSIHLPAHKTVVVGYPVRRGILALRGEPYRPHRPPRLLILGGSQGAVALNQRMIQLAPLLAAVDPHWKVVHQTGPDRGAELVQAAYDQAGLRCATAVPFLDAMAEAYRDADVVVCRSGAGTLAEVTVCGRPCVLVPFPDATDDHQTANAKALEKAGAALHIPQDQLSPTRLLGVLRRWADHPEVLKAMARCCWEQGKPHATCAMADVLEQEVQGV